MLTVDLLDQALRAAERLGYRVHHEWLGASGSGGCEFQGQKWLFLDLGLNPTEQLHVVADVLARESNANNNALEDPKLRGFVSARKIAA
ncbi:MAG TPA: hypothetical protein VGJ26_13005 [Pirellulales bacterium]|jgi:hypothetical protein